MNSQEKFDRGPFNLGNNFEENGRQLKNDFEEANLEWLRGLVDDTLSQEERISNMPSAAAGLEDVDVKKIAAEVLKVRERGEK
jgi:hypothetical protein